jgi:tripartite-type tricarboxylate transporter receptor subunit TctC
MKLRRRKFLHLAAVAVALSSASRQVWAQGYPTRPVRIIVGFPAGVAPDIVARVIGQALSERLGSNSSSRTGRAPVVISVPKSS